MFCVVQQDVFKALTVAAAWAKQNVDMLNEGLFQKRRLEETMHQRIHHSANLTDQLPQWQGYIGLH